MSKTKKKFQKVDKNLSHIIACRQCKTKMFADEAVISDHGFFCSEACAERFEDNR